MTKDQFEAEYAARSGVSVEFLHENGLGAIPCDCGEAGCKGWEMAGEAARGLAKDCAS